MIHDLVQYFLLAADALFVAQWICERYIEWYTEWYPRPFAG